MRHEQHTVQFTPRISGIEINQKLFLIKKDDKHDQWYLNFNSHSSHVVILKNKMLWHHFFGFEHLAKFRVTSTDSVHNWFRLATFKNEVVCRLSNTRFIQEKFATCLMNQKFQHVQMLKALKIATVIHWCSVSCSSQLLQFCRIMW